MLKKAGYILMTFLLLTATSGITIYRHYCGTSLVGSTVLFAPQDCCKTQCHCCHNEIVKAKISDQFNAGNSKFDFREAVKDLFYSASFPNLVLAIMPDPATLCLQLHKFKPLRSIPVPAANPEARLQVFLL